MVKYLIMDVDGTLTDGKIYMGPDGEAMKAFSIKDGYVINYILKPLDIIPVIITARESSIVQHRCAELGINEVYQGRLDKLSTLKEIVGDHALGSCAYFGDDVIDMKCMIPIKAAGGIIGCPSDAVAEIKAISDYVCTNKAGEGALREFAEWLIRPKLEDDEISSRIDEAIEYIKGLSVTQTDVGKKEVVNDYFYYSVQQYETRSESELTVELESHRKYIDVQFIVSGEEIMNVSDVSGLTLSTAYDEEKDIMMWEAPSRMMSVLLKQGNYIVLYPENAHRVVSVKSGSNQVLKIVGKVKRE